MDDRPERTIATNIMIPKGELIQSSSRTAPNKRKMTAFSIVYKVRFGKKTSLHLPQKLNALCPPSFG